MRKLVGGFVIIVLCGIIANSACSRRPAETRLGYLDFSSNLPLFVALEKGYFKDEQMEVRAIKMGSSNEALNALVAGSLDGTVGNGLSSLFAVWQSAPDRFKIYLPCMETRQNFVSYLLVRQDSPLKDITDLKGKKIGTYQGTTQLMYLKLFLKNFLDPDKDVTIIQVGENLQADALAAGQFDALFTIEPYATVALSRGMARVLMENPRVKYILDPFPAGANAIGTVFLTKYPDRVKKLYRCLMRAVEFIKSNPDEAKLILTKYTPIDKEAATRSHVYEWLPVEQQPEYSRSFQLLADMMYQAKILTAKIDTEKMLIDRKDLQ